MLVPDSQSCGYQFSSTSPLSASTVAASAAKTQALQFAVANAQIASDALLIANPWESWRGGMNLMKDIQRGNTQTGAAPLASDLPGAPASGSQLPGIPPAGEGGSLWDRFRRNLAGPGGTNGGNGGNQFVPDYTPLPPGASPSTGWRRGWLGPTRGGGGSGRGPDGRSRFVPDGTPFPADVGTVSAGHGWRHGWLGPGGAGNGNRSGNARGAADVQGWDSRFVTGPGGKFGTWPPGSNGGVGSDTVAVFDGWRRGRRGWVRDPRAVGRRRRRSDGGVIPPVNANSWPYGDSYGDGRPGNCGVIDCAASDAMACASEAVDVVPSDGILPVGAPVTHPAPPPNPALRTDQPDNIVVQPPFGYAAAISVPQPTARTMQRAGVAGMGEWTNSLQHPGAIPADCSTMGGGKVPPSVPWWLWLLGGVIVVAAVRDETKSRKASTASRKKAA
jgi:hypothetical protein